MKPLSTFILGFAALAFVSAASPASADCLQTDRQVRAVIKARQYHRLDEMHRLVTSDTSCDAVYKNRVGRLMARLTLRGIRHQGRLPTIRELKHATTFGRPWQALMMLGDAYYDRQDWRNAVIAYEEAIDDMRDVKDNPKAPPRHLEERIVKRAIQAKALAPTYVATRRFRGKKSGLASPKFRNFTAVAVPVPVQFALNSSDLTPNGRKAVEDMYAFLTENAHRELTLIGHTDEQGQAAYNKALSLRRADSVKSYLYQLGYTGPVQIIGRGESQPFRPDDPAKYSLEQRYAFDRRVEYKIVE